MSDNRLGNIGNILNGSSPRPRLVPDPTTTAARPPAPTTHAPAKRQATTAKPKPAPARQPAASSTAVTHKRVPVRLTQDLRDRLADRARIEDKTLAAVAFDAIEAAHAANKLADLVDASRQPAQTPHTVGEGSGLFQRTPARPPAQAKVTVEFRMTDADTAVLDQLVRIAKADNRSQLITAALRDHLAT